MARMLGVDFGERRVGLAVCDACEILATPFATRTVGSLAQAVDATTEASLETEAERIVVGLPLNMDGTSGFMAERVKAFVVALEARVGVPVVTWDERLTTSLVERTLIAADVSRRKRKASRDKLAAQAILQSYMDAQAFQRADDMRDEDERT